MSDDPTKTYPRIHSCKILWQDTASGVFAGPCRSLQDACLSRVEQVCLAGNSLQDFLARSSKIVLQGLARSAVTSKIY